MPAVLLVVMCVVVTALSATQAKPEPGPKISVAHRGAAAYAPEHTRAAYELAIQQGADYVEQDLGVTRDGVLVCLHDDSLERTTDVARRFPDRFVTRAGIRRWMVHDFTLAEIKQLDAGSWFDPKFAGERILTWDEAVELVNGRAGLYPELKSPALYRRRGVNIVGLMVEGLRRHGLERASSGRPPVIVQSFDADAIKALAAAVPDVPRVLLVDVRAASKWLSPRGLASVREFAQGVGPAKSILLADPAIVARAHAAGLTVTPYTFRSGHTGRFPDVAAEMRHFLYELNVDALFTDNPDQFPRR